MGNQRYLFTDRYLAPGSMVVLIVADKDDPDYVWIMGEDKLIDARSRDSIDARFINKSFLAQWNEEDRTWTIDLDNEIWADIDGRWPASENW